MIGCINKTVVDALKMPSVIHLSDNLIGIKFNLMKMLPAQYILDKAEEAHLVDEETVILESSSGTFALGLAMVCSLKKYRLVIVSDPAIDVHLKRRLEDLGAKVEIMSKPMEKGGYQLARLKRLHELRKEFPNHFWTAQYKNRYNNESYKYVADLMLETVGRFDYLVGSVGSGGSMCGSSYYLRRSIPELKSVAVDTNGSILFGQPEGKRLLRGLGNSIMPSNLKHDMFDEVHWVTAAEAFYGTRLLHKEHAIFMGGTSGASYVVGKYLAEREPHKKVCVILPDEGYRYQETIYNDDWLQENQLCMTELPKEPVEIVHPLSDIEKWSMYRWNRRSYNQVMGRGFNEDGELWSV